MQVPKMSMCSAAIFTVWIEIVCRSFSSLCCVSLHQQIMDIGGNKLKAVRSRLDMINSQIDQATGLKNKANVAAKTAKR